MIRYYIYIYYTRFLLGPWPSSLPICPRGLGPWEVRRRRRGACSEVAVGEKRMGCRGTINHRWWKYVVIGISDIL